MSILEEKLFINCTNHEKKNWSEEQLQAAEVYGEVVDFPFPKVKADADEWSISEMGERVFREIMKKKPAAVLCQGEFSLAFYLVQRFLKEGVTVLAACSEREVREEMQDGRYIKHAEFHFVRFRRYII